jgi:hypothetical protein
LEQLERLSHSADKAIAATGRAIEPRTSALLAALPGTEPSLDPSLQSLAQSEPLMSLREFAPVTCVAGWRFLIELRRDERRRQNIKHEILEIGRHSAIAEPPFWKAMIWVAIVLWSEPAYQSVVDAQAIGEGLVASHQAKANLQEHLGRLQDLLDVESDTVHLIRKETAVRNGARLFSVMPRESAS